MRTRAARNGRAHLSPRLAGCIPLAAVATIPGSPPLPLSLPPPSPSDSSPPPGLIRGVQRPPRTNMGTHLGIADPDAAAAVPVAPLPPTCFTADSKWEAAKARRQNPENVAIV